MSVKLIHGDCLEVMPRLPREAFDAVVCDPPYFLTSITKRFGASNAAPAQFGTDGVFTRSSAGFMGCTWDSPDDMPVDPDFANWLAGFIDGEGCFSVHKKNVNGCETYDCQFSLTLRDDDAGIIKEARQKLGGIGSIAFRPASGLGNSKPQIRWCVSSQDDCLFLREVLTAFPLRAKKARDFLLWSQALDEWIAHSRGGSWETVAYLRDRLMTVKKYGASFHPSQAFYYRWATRVYDLLKPGAHLVAFGGTRTYHRLACAIEDAGFEVRDSVLDLISSDERVRALCASLNDEQLGAFAEIINGLGLQSLLAWTYGQGFPKSHDVERGIAEELCTLPGRHYARSLPPPDKRRPGDHVCLSCPESLEWQGWGTSLKPSWEPIIVARKPLISTVAQNVLAHGTGALNIDACRVETDGARPAISNVESKSGLTGTGGAVTYGSYAVRGSIAVGETTQGRWPANLIHDGSDEVLAAFSDAPGQQGLARTDGSLQNNKVYGQLRHGMRQPEPRGDTGSAARFFYQSKATAADRAGSSHPTVKPIALIRWLCRLITPPGGLILDPFAGSGTTGAAANLEGFHAVLIEREAQYVADIQRRFPQAA